MLPRLIHLRPLVHVTAMLPLSYLGWLVATNNLGPDPAQYLVHELGFWGLLFLWLSLSMTPLRMLTGKPGWVAFRRATGLWSFAYVCLHLTVFLLAWCGLNIEIIQEEILERPYILLGVVAWLLMIPLAITSINALRRRLGRRWLQLHRMVYGIAVLGLLHLALVAKLEYLEPLLFGMVLIFLFFMRWRGRQGRGKVIECAPSA